MPGQAAALTDSAAAPLNDLARRWQARRHFADVALCTNNGSQSEVLGRREVPLATWTVVRSNYPLYQLAYSRQNGFAASREAS